LVWNLTHNGTTTAFAVVKGGTFPGDILKSFFDLHRSKGRKIKEKVLTSLKKQFGAFMGTYP
jgi:hypothetical protein